MTEFERQDETEKATELHDAAAECLQSAALQSDPREFDRLTRHTLGLIARARAIQHRRRAVSGSNEKRVTQDSSFMLREERPPVSRKYAIEFIGTLWLVLGGCGSAVLAAKFPETGSGLVGIALAFGFTVRLGLMPWGTSRAHTLTPL